MGGDSDTSFKIAAGLFGAVVIGLLALGAAKMVLGDGLDGAFGSGEDDYEECIDVAEGIAYGGNPYEGEVATRDDGASETVNATERGWSMHESTYSSPDAARAAYAALKLFDSDEMQECFGGGGELEPFPVGVEDGHGTVQRWNPDDDTWETSYSATWVDGDRVIGFTAWTTGDEDIEDWVVERYRAARAKFAEPAR